VILFLLGIFGDNNIVNINKLCLQTAILLWHVVISVHNLHLAKNLEVNYSALIENRRCKTNTSEQFERNYLLLFTMKLYPAGTYKLP